MNTKTETKHLLGCHQVACGCELLGQSKTPLIDRITEIGEQKQKEDFDISSIAEKAHNFIHSEIYKYESSK